MAIRCRLLGHRWRPEYAYSGRWVIAPMLLPFGFEFRAHPILVPERSHIVGISCARCGEQEPRYTITARGRELLEGKNGR